MLDKDFNWCFNHENLFRKWLEYKHNMRFELNGIFPLDLISDSNSTFLLWQEAKKYALEIANSVDPSNLFKIKMRDILTIKPDKSEIIMMFLITMLARSKNKNLEFFADLGKQTLRDLFRDFLRSHSIKKDKISIHEFYNLDNKSQQYLYFILLISGQIESDYDYSLPDGGIKDETETEETPQLEETAENNETLLERLKPIFYDDEKRAEDYIKKIKNKTKDVEIVRYTAQLVKGKYISDLSCHRDLYSILHDHRLYNKSESNWNKVINQYLVKK